MKTTQIIGMILIGIGIASCYYGFKKVNENNAQIKILGLQIDASNENGKHEGYFYLGIGVIAFGAGIYSATKK